MKALFFPKSLIGLILMSFLFASCGPLGPSRAEREATQAKALAVEKAKVEKAAADSKKAASKERARVKANKEAAARRARLKKSKSSSSSSSSAKKKSSGSSSSTTKKETTSETVSKPKPPTKPKSKYRTSTAIPGKPGFVFNPWTNKAVDVRGIPGGSVVRDPNDGDSSHKFRVP